MTDTNTLAPTDADIIALADETRTGEPGRDGYILPISFARAVLAKWGGSEAQAAAPIKTLEEAIAHAEDKAKGNSACALEHAKLAAWLTELQLLRAARTAPAPASQPVAALVGMEPVAWIEVHPGLDGWFLAYSFNPDAKTEPLYTAAQVQAMLAAAPRNAPLYDPNDVAFPVQRSADGTDALPPELASIAAAEAAAPINTLKEAIAHAKEVAKGGSTCALEHAKLAAWLTELQLWRDSSFTLAIEAETRKQDEALIRQMLEALEYHTEQTRPIARTDDAITAARLRLECKQ